MFVFSWCYPLHSAWGLAAVGKSMLLHCINPTYEQPYSVYFSAQILPAMRILRPNRMLLDPFVSYLSHSRQWKEIRPSSPYSIAAFHRQLRSPVVPAMEDEKVKCFWIFLINVLELGGSTLPPHSIIQRPQPFASSADVTLVIPVMDRLVLVDSSNALKYIISDQILLIHLTVLAMNWSPMRVLRSVVAVPNDKHTYVSVPNIYKLHINSIYIYRNSSW